MNSILDAFTIQANGHELISLVGAGGKTTTMFALAHALKSLNKRVLVTTTTNIFYPGKDQCDAVIVSNAPEAELFRAVAGGTVTVLGGAVVNDRKLAGVGKEYIERLHSEGAFDCILVECDGAKRKPIKAPAHYEPVVPNTTTATIGVIGLDALGKPIDEEHVHRAEIFSNVVGRSPGEPLDAEGVVTLILSPQGLFKGIPETSRRSVLLNKADTAERQDHAAAIVKELCQRSGTRPDRCVTAALATGTIYESAPLG